jgi:hypothetical protein
MSSTMDSTSPRPVPVWPGIPIILFSLVAGGWVTHWYLTSAPPPRESEIVATSSPAATPAAATAVGKIDGKVTENRLGKWTVRTGQATAELTVQGGNAAIVSAVYNSYVFIPAEVRTTITRARIIANDSDRIARLKLTPGQILQLIRLTGHITMKVSAVDQDLLCQQLASCAKAPVESRRSREAAVEQTLEEIAQRSRPATLQEARDRADQIITPEQWKLNSSIGG